MSRSIFSSTQHYNFFKTKNAAESCILPHWWIWASELRNSRDSAETCSRCRWTRFLCFSAIGCLSGLDGDWRQVCSILEQGRGSLKAVTIESTLYFDVFCAGLFCLSQQLVSCSRFSSLQEQEGQQKDQRTFAARWWYKMLQGRLCLHVMFECAWCFRKWWCWKGWLSQAPEEAEHRRKNLKN